MTGTLRRGPGLGPFLRLSPTPSRRRLTTVLVVLTLLAAAAVWYLNRDRSDDPASLDQSYLAGARGPACLRLVIGMDVSGSMTDYSAARNQALEQFVRWAGQPNTLRPNDEVAIVDFAFNAVVRSPPRPARQTVNLAPGGVTDGNSTLLTPLLDRLGAMPATRCDKAVVLLSDAQLQDTPTDERAGDALLDRYGVHDVRLLVPSAHIDVPTQWATAFPTAQPTVFDGMDPDSTALAFGRTVAGLVGQQLKGRT
ncbi:vWA domain-containing protein [Kutzneria sp. NPDC051319]|uniref:vWA domain-containing protein n=1 Tax=Kutzneria sp. NPDC051319 TaxID=3155047 RepID=UPI00342D7CF3